MLDAAVASTATRSIGRSANQLTGLAGIAFVAGVAIKNLALSFDEPLGDASIAEIANYFQGNESRATISVGLFMVNALFLVVFISGFYNRLRTTPAATSRWPIAAVIGAGLLGVAFGMTMVVQAVLIANADVLEEQPSLTQFVWDLQTSAFALNLCMLGILFIGVTRSAHLGELTPAWQNWLGYVGGTLLIASSTTAVAIIDGSPSAIPGLLGFICWLIWLATMSVRLLREAPE